MNTYTLNDFRSVLGKWNDGDVAFKQTEGGETLGKVNYGHFSVKEPTQLSVEANHRMRLTLLDAISNSVEGKALTRETLTKIGQILGTASDDLTVIDKPLSRHELQQVFNLIDDKPSFREVCRKQGVVLMAKGIESVTRLNVAYSAISQAGRLATKDGLVSCLPKGKTFNGFPSATVKKFIEKNVLSIQSHLFDKLYWMAYDKKPGKDDTWKPEEVNKYLLHSDDKEFLKSFVRETVTEMMTDFGAHREPRHLTDTLPTKVPEQVENPALDNDVSVHFHDQFAKADEAFDILQGNDGMPAPNGLTLKRLLTAALGQIKLDCNDAYTQNHSSLDEAENTWNEIARETGLDRLTPDLIRDSSQANLGDNAFKVRFQKALLARCATESMSTLTPQKALRIVGEVLKGMADDCDVEMAVKKHIQTTLRPGETNENSTALAHQVVETVGRDSDAMKTALLKLMKNDPTALDGLKDAMDDAIDKLNANADAKAARLNDLVNASRDPYGYLNAPDDLFGQLVTLLLHKGEKALISAGILNAKNGTFIDTEGNRRIVAEQYATFSTDDVDFACYYVGSGARDIDLELENNYTSLGKRPLFEGLRDGVINIREIVREGLLEIGVLIKDYLNRQGDNYDPEPKTYQNVDFETYSQGVFNSFCKDKHGEHKHDIVSKSVNPDKSANDFNTLNNLGNLGTADVAKILKLIKDAGIDTKRLDEPAMALRLQMLSKLCEFHPQDDVLEWAERIGGKSVAEMSFEEMYRVLVNRGKDPLVDIANVKDGPAYKSVATFLDGSLRISEANLSADDLMQLMPALGELSTAAAGASRKMTLSGVDVTISVTPSGGLKAVVTAPLGKAMIPITVRVPQDAAELKRQLENEIVRQSNALDPAVVKSILPNPAAGTQTVSRIRELCTKVICTRLGVTSVQLASVTLKKLHELALLAADGKLTTADLPQGVSNSYNSQETIELHDKLVAAQKAETNKVQMPATGEPRTREDRERTAPPDGEVRDLLADLIMNKETWFFDGAQNAASGDRIKKVLLDWGPELKHILKDIPHFLETVPEGVRDTFADILGAIQDLGTLEAAPQESLAALETKIATSVDALMASLQVTMTNVFATKPGEDTKPWEQSFAEMAGTNGIDDRTPNGKFLKKVLDTYLTSSGPIEKRAMLSAMLRNTKGDSSDAKQVAELLKGAGPILQKMLQGLPLETFGPETQLALKDMKSRLAPIPDDVVKAQMLELIRSSDGQVKSVKVIKPIGAATVAQTFLCHIKTKEHPISGEDVVIKVLRPNALNAAQREYAFLSQIAKEVDGMSGPFENQYKGILEEFDFTHEAENVDLGVKAYDRPMSSDNKGAYGNVRSMRRHPAVPPASGLLVLSKVEGETYDTFIESAKDKIAEISGVRPFGLPDEGVRQDATVNSLGEQQKRRHKLLQIRNAAVERRHLVEQFTDAWVHNALLGDGFLHGDLHAGNLMTDGKELSVIDYGNAMRLTKEQKQGLLRMMTSAMAGEAGDFLKAYSKMEPSQADNLARANAGKALEMELQTVFNRGNANDGTSRLTVAIALLQRAGLPVPAPVSCFTQSLNRLQAVVSGLDDVIQEAENTIGVIRLKEPENRPELPFHPEFVNGNKTVKVFETLEQMLDAVANEPDAAKISQIKQGINDLLSPGKLAETIETAFKNRTKDEIVHFTEAFLKRYEHLSTYGESSGTTSLTFYKDVRGALESLQKDDSAENRKRLANSLQLQTADFFNSIARHGIFQTERADLSTFSEVATEAVLNDVKTTVNVMAGRSDDNKVELNGNAFVKAAKATTALLASGGFFGVPKLIEIADTLPDEIERMKQVLKTAKTNNASRKDNVRISPRETLALDTIAREVRLLNGNKVPKSTDTANLIATLKANVLAARKALKPVLGLDDPRNLTEGETLYLAEVLNGATNGELSKSLMGIPEQQRTAFMESVRNEIGEDAVALFEALIKVQG